MTTENFDADHIHTTPDGRHFRHGDGLEVDGEGDLVRHNGKTYRLADLAHYMEDEQREAVHASHAYEEGSAEQFWAEFVRRYPAEADHLAEITPSAD